MSLSGPQLLARYAAFAVAATLANLAVQAGLLRILPGPLALPAALIAGTGAGLVIKYLLDKRWIFDDRSRGMAAHGKRFSLYTLTGVATTLLFWGSEYLFWALSDGRLWYVGAVLGLAGGYVLKFHLDRQFVFRAAT